MSKEDVEAIGTAFAAETNRRDEDTEMYVKISFLLKYNTGLFYLYINRELLLFLALPL
jgi:hypothetical protein